ncbi:hypothetical protein COCCADRAFT_81089 [Bipolaris zeicola 26-R-13]|uniref:Uncharacterized protein n=1 Tax=Cochliobolus carbonum (strain 26-R-13) TaxID=930089 RepID=W6YUT1_COCC2|nr:uncharacterized protein COCCADRAFT_81089 [Bipolaris zeicola 26-R-13]EUC39229.1 hypothetical protein COCCADRAFT_81089 [Bipolaris zeicola 26-R-13]
MPAAYQTRPCAKKTTTTKKHRQAVHDTRAPAPGRRRLHLQHSRIKQNRVDGCRHQGFSWPSWQRNRLRFQGMQRNAMQREASAW